MGLVDIRGLAQAMTYLHQRKLNHDDLHEIGAKGREFAEQFSWDAIADQFIARLEAASKAPHHLSTPAKPPEEE